VRHIIIGGLAERLAVEAASRQEATLADSTPSELPTTESLVAVRGTTELSEQRLREFHATVRDFLHAQDLFEETRDPVIRRVADAIKKQLRAEVGWLAADFAAADARVRGCLPAGRPDSQGADSAAVEGGGL
jgi:hypothetical protein